MILLIDDTRNFKVPRGETIARSSTEAIAILSENDHFEEIWFDCILAGHDQIIPVLAHLLNTYKEGTMPTISRALIHTSTDDGAMLIDTYLKRIKIETVIRVNAREYMDEY